METKQNTDIVTKRLVIELNAAKGRLEKVKRNAEELEKSSPQAFAEIRKAKNIVAAATAIVMLYAKELESRHIKA